jgi:hypothetical protein
MPPVVVELVQGARFFHDSKMWIEDDPDCFSRFRPRSLQRKTAALRRRTVMSKRLTNAHTKRVTVSALRYISTQIDVILLA